LLVQALPFFGPAAVHWPCVAGHWLLSVQAFCVQGLPPHWAGPEHTVVPFGQVLVWHSPPVKGHWAALWHTVTPLLHRPFVAWQVAAVWHCWPAGLLHVPGQSEFTRQAAPPS